MPRHFPYSDAIMPLINRYTNGRFLAIMQRIPLSPVDHIFYGPGGYPINFIFFFEKRLNEKLLKSSLEKILPLFSPVASKIVKNSQSESLEFVYTGEYGWHLREISTIPDPDNMQELNLLLVSAKSLPNSNPLEVTITHHPQGTVLGVSLSHCVADGYSYFMFLLAWSKALKGQEVPTPDLDRQKLHPETLTQESSLRPEDIFEQTGFSFVSQKRPDDMTKIKWEIIDYSNEEIKNLYTEVAKEIPERLSINDVICADIWKKLVKIYQAPGQSVILSCAFDYRRLHPNLSPLYFGNAIRGASFELPYETIEDMPISNIAQRISQTVRKMNSERVFSSLSCLENVRTKSKITALENFHVAHPERGFLFTNLSRLPLLDLDFGEGSPVNFRILTPAKRACVILPLPNGLRVQIAH